MQSDNERRAPMPPRDAGPFRHQEIAFSIAMGVVAILSRDNPVVVYPQILWAFEALLAFNLAYHYVLKRHGAVWFVPLVSLAANLGLTTAVLSASGGSESFFWPMYLLPVFSACLALELRHVLLALSASAAFLAYFYLDFIWELAPWQCLEVFVKIAVLSFAAAVTTRVAFSERRQRSALEARRDEVERLSLALGRKEELDLEAERMKTLGQLSAGVLHNLNGPLTVILGSASLMLDEAPQGSLAREDLERILLAANACGRLTQNLVTCLRADPLILEDADIGAILKQAVNHFDYQIKSRGLCVSQDVPAGLPRLKVSPVCLQLTLFDLLNRASRLAASGGCLKLKAVCEREGVGIRIACDTRGGAESGTGLESCRDLLSRSRGWLDSRARDGAVEYRIHLRQGG